MVNMLKFFTLVVVHFASINCTSLTENFLPKLQITPSAKDAKKFDVRTIGYWCPPETEEDVSNVDRISHIPGKFRYKYCVFEEPMKDENKTTCGREVQPVFLPNKNSDKKLISCDADPNKRRFVYSFGFYYCGGTNQLAKFRREFTAQLKTPQEHYTVDVEVMYEMCYDVKTNRALRTRHTIMKPPIFASSNDKNAEDQSNFEISTDPFDLHRPDFIELKEKYELENEKNSKKGVVPYPLVPPSHFAVPIWRKSTQHIINMAPLWKFLIPVMFAIDEGLKKAQMKLYLENPQNYDKLVIYTKVENAQQPIEVIPKRKLNNKINIKPPEKPIFPPKIWYKFIHRRNKNHGVLIYVHSTPDNIPSRKCRELSCDFAKWIEDTDKVRAITEDVLRFAYCCQTDEDEVRKLFSINVEIDDILQLNGLIKPHLRPRL